MQPHHIFILGVIGVILLAWLITWDAHKPHKQQTPP